jgi:hypothetical protein
MVECGDAGDQLGNGNDDRIAVVGQSGELSILSGIEAIEAIEGREPFVRLWSIRAGRLLHMLTAVAHSVTGELSAFGPFRPCAVHATPRLPVLWGQLDYPCNDPRWGVATHVDLVALIVFTDRSSPGATLQSVVPAGHIAAAQILVNETLCNIHQLRSLTLYVPKRLRRKVPSER